MVKGCANPPYIHRTCLDSCENYNIKKNYYFDLFRHCKIIQKQGGIKVSKSKSSLGIHYEPCQKGKSPGFLVVLETYPGARYRLETTASLERGDKALIGIESLKPSCNLLSKTPSINGGKKSFEITFQAISDFTVIGYFFHCNTKEYCLNVDKFKVVSCDPKDGCHQAPIKAYYRCETCHHYKCRCHNKNGCKICLKNFNDCKCHKKYSCTVCYKCTKCYKCTECESCAVCCVCYSPCLRHDVILDSTQNDDLE